MRLTPEDTTVRMLREVNRRLSNLESRRDIDEIPVQIRTVIETETSSDATEESVDNDPGWEWGTSEWGFDVWN